MKNDFIRRMENRVKVSIKGRSVDRFLRNLISKNIQLLDINYPSRKEIQVVVSKGDYERIKEIKTSYDISILETYGKIRYKEIIHSNYLILITSILGFIFLLVLSNIIFSIDIIHGNSKLRALLKDELDKRGVNLYTFRKSFNTLEKISEDIIISNKDKIEWLEIENVGTKYIIRVEERKLPIKEQPYRLQHVVAKKSAIIKVVYAKSGEILKNTNDYVNANEVVISGNITLNGTVKSSVQAMGTVYGEVWYQTTVEYPFVYTERQKTGRKNKVYVFKFLNWRFELLNFRFYKEKDIHSQIVWSNNLLPISLVKEDQEEVRVIHELYTEEEVLNKGEELAIKKMQDTLDKDEYIINAKKLKINIKESKIILDVFLAVYENITAYQKIEVGEYNAEVDH